MRAAGACGRSAAGAPARALQDAACPPCLPSTCHAIGCLRRWARRTRTRSSTSSVLRREVAHAAAGFAKGLTADARAATQFGIELDDVTTEKQIIRKEHHKTDEGVGEDEEARLP